MEYAAVAEALLSRDEDNRVVRIHQVSITDIGEWPILSGRCHIRVGEGFLTPRLGHYVSDNLRAPYRMVMTRLGNRVTICEVETGMVQMSDGTWVDIPVGRQVALHESIMDAQTEDLRLAQDASAVECLSVTLGMPILPRLFLSKV